MGTGVLFTSEGLSSLIFCLCRLVESPVTESLIAFLTLIISSVTAQASPPPETLIKMMVDPMAAPKPALKYLLLPELREMTQGNPIPLYLKAVLDQDMTAPGSNLGPGALKQADRAARMDKPDWQILPKLKTDGINLLLPDLQKMRELANALRDRFRDEIAQRRFDDALATAKTMFALSRHLGEHPTLIGVLVGTAIAFIAIGPLEEMLEQPGCPNLYWALSNLPVPLLSYHTAVEGERLFIMTELRDLNDKEPMTAAQLKKLMKYIDGFRDSPSRDQTREWLSARAKDEKYMDAARKQLIDSGIPQERLDLFSNYQVILLNEKFEYEIERDEIMKFMNLPMWEVVPHLSKVRPRSKILFAFFLPGLDKIRISQGRLEQRIALLRHVEALRLHAAAHNGKLPEKLTDIKVPLPMDPFTGKPFRYEVKDGVGHLRGTPPKGYEDLAHLNLHYEITIRK